jgi:hypothetical protein
VDELGPADSPLVVQPTSNANAPNVATRATTDPIAGV